jgi:hypothetical protein
MAGVAIVHGMVYGSHMGTMPVEDLRKAFPWLKGFQEVVRTVRPAPFSGSALADGIGLRRQCAS